MVRLRSPAPYFMGEFPSGQRGQTVNLLSLTSLVRIQLPPPIKNTDLVSVFFYGREEHIQSRRLLSKCDGSHTLTKDRRACSSGEGHGYIPKEYPASQTDLMSVFFVAKEGQKCPSFRIL